ncbi:hypothetical protein GUITHDRAFT_106414 [Guillardia theta CCMP2712]|uniref:Uncharacterized protein n=1 Tax=Guillardia theta (strain CCMP2712) TaxID=905079 RepID=L1JIE8_GUITC|nr:hypothetical protein GUITHDRAFT_106414 [Guillardia theta CCMP2712]EKX47865.1 hypothetical protein GUITHDRAFT_106414 [Guillardia theta CCMP2712]|eukprot:XP_005834845.1 hypothetical protein GUITHDRAFT_106414 [Guillardia theta CCMP2712]
MTVIAETSALIAGFQMIMFYELPQPSLTEYEFSSVLLAVWGLLCLFVACTNLCVLFAAMIIAVNMLDASSHETVGGATSPQGRRAPFSRDNPDGFIDDAQGMEILWQVRHEKRYIQVLNLFAVSIPFFVINVGITTFVKFYSSTCCLVVEVSFPSDGAFEMAIDAGKILNSPTERSVIVNVW